MGKAVAALQQRRRVQKGGYLDLDLDPRRTIMKIVTACRALVGNDEECESMPIFAPGDDVWAAANHDSDAIYGRGQPAILNYASKDSNKARGVVDGWYETYGNADVNECMRGYDTKVLHCDEYPFMSTAQGGPGASLRVINRTDNIKEGARLEGFYNTCDLKNPIDDQGDTKKFIVIPIQGPMRGFGFNSAAWCGSEAAE